jgi:glucose 1-dehydrogenase
MGKLAGKIAIVTGAARGIGLACAKRFIAEGAKVVLADIDERGALEAKHLGGEARFVRCDVGEAKDAANLIAETCQAFSGDIDILVNNAGIVHGADFIDLKESDFDRVLRTNLKGAFLVGQLAARKMIEQVKAGKKPGAIVNMASINSTVAIANQVPYSVSKGGLLQLTRTMALALAPYGIRVNAIGPGSIMTEILSAVARRSGGFCRARRSAASASRTRSRPSRLFSPRARPATSRVKLFTSTAAGSRSTTRCR